VRAKTTAAEVKVLTAVEGIYRDGEIELLERPEGLKEARVVVTFLPPSSTGRSREEARDRMLARMQAGISLGGAPYPRREDVYDRGRKA
jgi:hypothetical protein